MRVVSLLPSATEMLCAIGGRSLLVGRTHGCDTPEGLDAPVLTAPRAHPPQGPCDPEAIDARVRPLRQHLKSHFTLDTDHLGDLRPDLILTQDLCSVCSIDLARVRTVAADLRASGRADPVILNLNPRTIEDVLDDLIRIGQATGLDSPATATAMRLQQRLLDAQSHVNPYDDGPVVGFLEWTDPLFVAGHWTVQMIERAGGRHPLNPTLAPEESGAAAGLQQGVRRAGGSIAVPSEVFASTRAQWLVIAPCGLGLESSWEAARSLSTQPWFESVPAVRAGRVAVVDGSQMFNRPGPRLAEAFEWLVSWLQNRPEIAPSGFPWRAWAGDGIGSPGH